MKLLNQVHIDLFDLDRIIDWYISLILVILGACLKQIVGKK